MNVLSKCKWNTHFVCLTDSKQTVKKIPPQKGEAENREEAIFSGKISVLSLLLVKLKFPTSVAELVDILTSSLFPYH